MLDDFIKHLEERNYSPKSIEAYKLNVEAFLAYIATKNLQRIQDVNLADIEGYQLSLLDRNLSLNSIDVYIRSIRRYFQYMDEAGIIFENPMEHLKRPRVKAQDRFTPTISDMKLFISFIDLRRKDGIRSRAIIETLYSCGLRLHELLKMSIFDIDLKNKQARIYGKGRKERVVPLTKSSVFYIEKYLMDLRPMLLNDTEENHLWLSNYGNKLSERALQNMLAELSSKAGFSQSFTPHTIRRACATHLLQNGAPPAMIQELLGHSNSKSLSHYLKLSITDIKKMHQHSRLGK